MSRIAPAVATLLLVALSSMPLASAAPPASDARAQQDGEFAKGRIIVIPRAGLKDGAMATALGEVGGRGRRLGGSGLHIVEVPAGSERAAVERMSRHRHMKFADLDRRIPPDLITNDPYMGSAWHLPVISAPTAWDQSLGRGVVIAILDSGVDGSHPDLAARIVPGWNFYDNNADTTDVYGHGTKVAGAAAASSNNGAGVAGVAGQASIMPIRVTDTSGYAYTSTLVQGLTWAADHGARIANISFEAAGMSSVIAAANYMRSKNGLVTVSAGNSGALSSTAPTTSMITVSATSSSDQLASWSNYGNVIALAAPGVSIWTTIAGGGYKTASGTSFAAPVTAGTVALMMAAQPTLTNVDIEKLLYSSATDLGTAGRDVYFGHGRVNAGAAVQAAMAAAVVADTKAPTVAIAAPLASSTVSGQVSVDTSSSDNIGVVRAELRVNGSTVATDTSAPFAFSWDSTTVANGMANLSVVAYDAAGNSATSSVVAVNVANAATKDTTKPVVTIISPTTGSTANGKVTVNATFSDNSGSTNIKHRLFINNVRVVNAYGNSLTYTWDSSTVAAGSYTFKAWAIDNSGNEAAASVTVTKSALAASISAPAASSTVSGLVSVDAAASGGPGVARVELRVNGTTVATDTSAPFAFSWDSTTVANGLANLSVVAYDAAGNSASSSIVAVNVANAGAMDTTKPVVTIISPTTGSTANGKVTLNATFSDNSGSTNIKHRLFINNVRVVNAYGNSLTYTWDSSTVAAGSYTFKAWAIDDSGNEAVASVTVTKQ